jgi:hypothetical protein
VCGEGGALAGVLKPFDELENIWWSCHSGPTSPGTGSVHRQLLPGLLLWQPNQSMEKLEEGVCPCFVWQLSQLNVAWGKRRHVQQNMVDLSSFQFRNSKHQLAQATTPHDLNCPQAFVQLGSATHQAEEASLHLTVVHRLSWIQGVTLNTRCHGLIIADTQGGNEVTWSPSHLLIWHHLFSSNQVTLSRKWMLEEIALHKLCFLVFIFLWISA